ncbi:MAG TPA: acyltransferase [Trueperaceae bacterium]|nr:acyltransferase [Trueperaceae bacterium]
MPWLLDRPLDPNAEGQLERFVGELAERLDDASSDRNVTVRETLAPLLYGRPFHLLEAQAPMAAFGLDPRNVTFEAEYYAATDPERFARVKPLLWLWKSLDATPLGQSVASGVAVRRMLAERIFARAGRNLKIFQNVEVSVGYNIEAGDDVVIHRDVFIDDIGGVELHDGASLSDYANVYSHTHDILEQPDVTLKRTVIGRDVRVAYHATVLAGTVLSDDSMLGALALATHDLEPHVVGLGIPAKPRVWKERSNDPRFASLRVDARRRPSPSAVRANPDFRDADDDRESGTGADRDDDGARADRDGRPAGAHGHGS